MKRILLAGVAAISLASAHPAHAIFGAGDIVFEPVLEQTQIMSNLKSAASWLQQARDMVQQYRMLENQYQALAHLPQQAMNLGRNLTMTPSLQNPLPQANTLTGILDGSSLGSVNGLASQFASRNRYYDPQGDDFSAQEMRARAQGTAGLQALAQQGAEAVEQRLASLREFFDGIEGSGDVQETEAINARLSLENNFINAQSVQAQQLMVLAKAQEQSTQLRAEERSRQDAEELVRATSGVPLPGVGQ